MTQDDQTVENSGTENENPVTDSKTVSIESASSQSNVQSVDALGLGEVSGDFTNFLTGQAVPFLNIMDIPEVGARRAALIQTVGNVGRRSEEVIQEKMRICEAVILLQLVYASATGNVSLIKKGELFAKKMKHMKSWIGL